MHKNLYVSDKKVFMRKFSDSKMSSEGSNLIPDIDIDDVIPGPVVGDGMNIFLYIFVYYL